MFELSVNLPVEVNRSSSLADNHKTAARAKEATDVMIERKCTRDKPGQVCTALIGVSSGYTPSRSPTKPPLFTDPDR